MKYYRGSRVASLPLEDVPVHVRCMQAFPFHISYLSVVQREKGVGIVTV